MLNRIILMGRLVRDPELRRTQSGTAVAAIRLAVDRDYKARSGEKQADFFDVVAWRATAEFVSKYFAKGRMAVVEGRLQTRDWTDKDGSKRVATEIVAEKSTSGTPDAMETPVRSPVSRPGRLRRSRRKRGSCHFDGEKGTAVGPPAPAGADREPGLRRLRL